MRFYHFSVRLVSLPFERSSSRDAQPHPEDDCKDSKCTESLVLDIVAAVDAATVACVDLEEVLDSGLAEKIVGVVIVSLELLPESDAISSQLVW